MTTAAAPDIESIRARLGRAFRPEGAEALEAVYQFCIAGEDAFHLSVGDGDFTVGPGRHPAPTVTFFYEDLETALGVVDGQVDAMSAFMAGRIRTDGNLILALQLGLAFRA
jgi:putative sterol carrier protein